MSKLKAVIVEDEEASRITLRNYINKYCTDVEVQEMADSVQTGIQAIKKVQPFANVGGTACEVEMWLGYGLLEPEDGPIVVWPQFEIHNRYVELFASDTHGDTIQLVLNYKDATGNQYTAEFAFVRTSHGDFPSFEIR